MVNAAKWVKGGTRMKRYKRGALCGVVLFAVFCSGCTLAKTGVNWMRARDQLNKGVTAFRNAQFQAAINYFQDAVNLDPTLMNARLYLATAYAQQYIPGGESPENLKNGQQAIAAFEDVLQRDSNNSTAIASVAQIYYNMKQFDKAKEYQRRRLQLEPNDPEPYYWIGVIDWVDCFARDGKLRKDLKIDQPDPKTGGVRELPEKNRTELEKENGPLVDEGLKALQKSLDLKPNDADAMAYLNLMLRQKAEIEAKVEDRNADLKQAEEWVQKALAAKKAAAEKEAAKSS